MRPPDIAQRNSSPEYLRALLVRAGLSQRAAARALGVGERTMRDWVLGKSRMPYPAQYVLEALADRDPTRP